MDFHELEQEEQSRTLEIAKQQSMADLALVDVARLYPEYSFAETYGLHDHTVPLNKYLVLYEQVIFNVHPVASVEDFAEVYGISFENFLGLVRIKKVLPVICYPYARFPKFFEELFKTGDFPRSGRLRIYLELAGNRNKEKIETRVEKIVRDKDFSASIKRLLANYHGTENEKLELFINSFSSDLYDFELLGMHGLVEVILEIAGAYPNEAHRITLDYCNCLGRPFFDNAGGINTFSDQTLRKAKEGYLKTQKLALNVRNSSIPSKPIKTIENFVGVDPTELIGFLDQTFDLDFPTHSNSPISTSEMLDSNPVIQELRATLASIKLEKIGKNSISDFERISDEVCKLLKKDAKRLKLASTWTADTLLLGSILPSIAGQLYFDKSFTNILYGTVYPTLVGTRYDVMKEFAKSYTGEFFEKLLSKPMATLYWKSTSGSKR
ncbi:MAG: hypothetical protein RJB34_1601 [Pseudomonadota bacterium]|jgi:hypothetical protein